MTNPVGSHTIGVTAALNSGDSVWVWGLLQTPATNGSIVDAHTFTTSWDNTADLIPAAIASIPEPETYAMLLAGLGVLGFELKRRRKAALV